MKRLHFPCFVSSPNPSLLLMVQRNPPQAVWYHLALSWCNMTTDVEARRAIKQKYRLRQTTSHPSLLTARQGDISGKLNQAFLLVDSFNFNYVDEERSEL